MHVNGSEIGMKTNKHLYGDIAGELMCRVECRWIHINDHGFGVMLDGYLIIICRRKKTNLAIWK
jgi:hypothetical protein